MKVEMPFIIHAEKGRDKPAISCLNLTPIQHALHLETHASNSRLLKGRSRQIVNQNINFISFQAGIQQGHGSQLLHRATEIESPPNRLNEAILGR